MPTSSLLSFGCSANCLTGIISGDDARVKHYIDAVNSVVMLTNQNFYIIDYEAQKIIYVSPNDLLWSGVSPETIMKQGYGFFKTHMLAHEWDMIRQMYDVAFKFFNALPLQERWHFRMNCDFHIVNGATRTLLLHRLMPLALNPRGQMRLGLYSVSLSPHDCAGNMQVHLSRYTYWRYDAEQQQLVETAKPKLTLREKEVLRLSACGLSVAEIAKQLCRSRETIKSRRQAIFSKLKVDSIGKALIQAANYNLL